MGDLNFTYVKKNGIIKRITDEQQKKFTETGWEEATRTEWVDQLESVGLEVKEDDTIVQGEEKKEEANK